MILICVVGLFVSTILFQNDLYFGPEKPGLYWFYVRAFSIFDFEKHKICQLKKKKYLKV